MVRVQDMAMPRPMNGGAKRQAFALNSTSHALFYSRKNARYYKTEEFCTVDKGDYCISKPESDPCNSDEDPVVCCKSECVRIVL